MVPLHRLVLDADLVGSQALDSHNTLPLSEEIGVDGIVGEDEEQDDGPEAGDGADDDELVSPGSQRADDLADGVEYERAD